MNDTETCVTPEPLNVDVLINNFIRNDCFQFGNVAILSFYQLGIILIDFLILEWKEGGRKFSFDYEGACIFQLAKVGRLANYK